MSSSSADAADDGSATSKWMKMISSTFLGEATGASLFARRASGSAAAAGGVSPAALSDWAKLRAESKLDPTPQLKIALVGGSAVGKTSIVRRWLQRSYPATYSPTIGVDVNCLGYRHRGQELLLQLWDISSAEADASAASLHALLCEDLDGIFFVFNVHRVSSIAAVDKWRHCLAKYLSPKETPCFLLSHKADLLQKRVMTSDDIAAYAQAAGYRGWMWTVGKPNFGENERNPAVKEALERMVEFICKDRIATEHTRVARLTRPLGILETVGNPAPLEIIQTEDALHHFSTSLLRIPTKAITTLPRDENMMPINENFNATESEEKREDAAHVAAALRSDKRAANYGGNWILGNNKGVYLRATNSSLLGNDETDDDSESVEEFTFPFSSSRQINDDDDAAATAEARRREKEEEDRERRKEEERVERDRRNDKEAWHFFAGSISRAQAEKLLENRGEGTFLLRRKDAQTLILSYMGPDHVHHVLIEFSNQRYHVGSSKASLSTSFATLWKCLRSVRRYAYRGLIFSRNVDFSVVNKQELIVEDESIASGSPTDATTPTNAPTTPGSIWRARTRSGSSSSLGDRSSNSNSRHASPTTATRKPRHSPGLQANQEQVQIPTQTRVDELTTEFYDHLAQRLSYLDQQQKAETPEAHGRIGLSEDIAPLLEMVNQEKSELRQVHDNNAETQWRQLVKNMEAWNRIVMNLELCSIAP